MPRPVLLRCATVAGVAALLAVSVLIAPRSLDQAAPVTGDDQLAAAVAPHLDGHHKVAVALLEEDGSARYAGFGVDRDTRFEIGSVTKTFTGALLLEAVDRGELALDTTVSEVLEDAGRAVDPEADIATVTLRELASHTSGLPSTPLSRVPLGAIRANFLGADPYRATPEEIIDLAAGAPTSGRGDYDYSNFGVALLGQLLALDAGTDYEALVADRLLVPLGLAETTVPVVPGSLPEDALTGTTAVGHARDPWTLRGSAPAGGIRSSASDMVTWLRTMQDGTNPGAAGLDPVAPAGEGTEIAVSWHLTTRDDGTRIVWHNGMTGGFAAYVGYDPATGRGAVVLTDSAQDVTGLGERIAAGEVAG